MIKLTYNEIHALSGYSLSTYPIQSACKNLLEQGISGRLEVYPNDPLEDNGDRIPDVVYPSISYAANNANASYIQKGHHYACWYPRVEKNRKSISEILRH